MTRIIPIINSRALPEPIVRTIPHDGPKQLPWHVQFMHITRHQLFKQFQLIASLWIHSSGQFQLIGDFRDTLSGQFFLESTRHQLFRQSQWLSSLQNHLSGQFQFFKSTKNQLFRHFQSIDKSLKSIVRTISIVGKLQISNVQTTRSPKLLVRTNPINRQYPRSTV